MRLINFVEEGWEKSRVVWINPDQICSLRATGDGNKTIIRMQNSDEHTILQSPNTVRMLIENAREGL